MSKKINFKEEYDDYDDYYDEDEYDEQDNNSTEFMSPNSGIFTILYKIQLNICIKVIMKLHFSHQMI